MTVRAFADSNLFIYAESDDGEKSAIATALIEAQPVASVQAITLKGYGAAEGIKVLLSSRN